MWQYWVPAETCQSSGGDAGNGATGGEGEDAGGGESGTVAQIVQPAPW